MSAKRIGWGDLAARVAAASVGAYGLCYAWIAALVLLLPRVTSLDGVDATIVATCGAFLLFVALILRAFALRSVVRLWSEIALGTAIPLAFIGSGWR